MARSIVYKAIILFMKVKFIIADALNTNITSRAVTMSECREKIVIDNDAGGDDAMAIFMALLNEKHFNGGSKSALVVPSPSNNHYGIDGLGDTGEAVTGLVPTQEQGAVTTLIELSKKYEGHLIVVTIGPVTNIALAIALDPEFLGRLKHLYIGAGHIHSDKHPDKEFNARIDPEAYYIIAREATPDKVTIVPFSQIKDSLDFSKEWRLQVLGAINTEIMKEQNKFEQVAMKKSERWQKLDPATVAVALRPDLVEEYRYSKNSIHLCGDNRGIITNKVVPKEEANVRVLHAVKFEEYEKFLIDIFSKE